MTTKIRFNKSYGAAIAAATFLTVGMFFVAYAASVFDITYPIPELGNCTDRLACKAYCDDPASRSACETFAQKYGLTVRVQPQQQSGAQPQSESAGNDRMRAVQQDGGPGQCAAGASDPEQACQKYCNDVAHIQECVAYGKSHGLLTGDQLAQAEKVAAALARGVPLPSGCTDQQSCQQVCQNPSTLDQAKSCFAFGKAAGLLPPGFNEAQAEKVFTAVQNGTAPFSSMKDFQQCQNATDPAIIKKCTDFAVQSGMMTQQQAGMLQQTGGKGPGGCMGQDACNQYCADHQDECFQFAQQHGLISPDQQNQMKQAAAQMQDAIGRAPDAVKQCIVAAIGQDTLDAIMTGTKPGSSEIGQKMQTCFQQFQGSNQGGGQQGPPPQGKGQYGPPCPPVMNDSSSSQNGAPPCAPPQNGGQYGPPCPLANENGSSTENGAHPCMPPPGGPPGQYGPPPQGAPCPPVMGDSSSSANGAPPCPPPPGQGGPDNRYPPQDDHQQYVPPNGQIPPKPMNGMQPPQGYGPYQYQGQNPGGYPPIPQGGQPGEPNQQGSGPGLNQNQNGQFMPPPGNGGQYGPPPPGQGGPNGSNGENGQYMPPPNGQQYPPPPNGSGGSNAPAPSQEGTNPTAPLPLNSSNGSAPPPPPPPPPSSPPISFGAFANMVAAALLPLISH